MPIRMFVVEIKLIVPLAMLFASVGCGGGVGDVSGKVSYKGKPVTMGSVLVIGSDKVPRYGPIQKDGQFAIAGVPVGEAKVAVNSPDPRTLHVSASNKLGGQSAAAPSPADIAAWFPLPEKAGDPLQSGLTIAVNRGANVVALELKDN